MSRIKKTYKKGDIVYCYVGNERGTVLGLNKRYSQKHRPVYNVQLDTGEKPAITFDNMNTKPVFDDDIDVLSTHQLRQEVLKLRAGIRKYRDQTGHDLCWYNPELTGLLPEQTGYKPYVPPFCEFIQNCAKFRQSLEGVESTQKSEWLIVEEYGDGMGTVAIFAKQVLGQHEYMVARTDKDGTISRRYFRHGKSHASEEA